MSERDQHHLGCGDQQPTSGGLRRCSRATTRPRDVIADGAGWTDPDRQQPVGDTGRHEPHQVEAIVEAGARAGARRPRFAAGHRTGRRPGPALVLDVSGPRADECPELEAWGFASRDRRCPEEPCTVYGALSAGLRS